MKQRSLTLLATLLTTFVLSGCNDSEIDKITLIGKDKSALESTYKTLFIDKSPDSEWFGLEDKNAADGQNPYIIGTLIKGKVEFSIVTRIDNYSFIQLNQMLSKEYGKPVATRDHIFDAKAIAGLDCVEKQSCNAGRYYEVFRGKDRMVMLQDSKGKSSEPGGVTLMTITDQQLNASRLEKEKLKATD